MSKTLRILVLVCICALTAATDVVNAQRGAVGGEWRHYGGDGGGTKYSPLDQINASNVHQLQIVWRWKSANFGPRPQFNWQVTPLMVGGVLYFTAGVSRTAVAVDAVTGETLWTYRFDEGVRGVQAPRTNNRGLAYWSDGAKDSRVVMISPGYHLIALDAKTGRPVPQFGVDGIVDLWEGLNRKVEPGQIGSSSPPTIVGDVVVAGNALQAGTAPRSKTNVPGYIRGYDVRSGKLLWTFHTIPQGNEFGNDTWEEDSALYTGNTGAWAPISADLELGYVYVPIETPTGDYYGGHRHGDNLFADSIVCLDARTGRRIWHFQLIHHDVWDWDTASAPVLMDVTIDGRPKKIVVQVTKQGFAYVFDRVTGEPVWPIMERPVPQSDVPGEKTSPTQPFPTRPAPFDRQGVTEDDLIDLTPKLKAEALRIASQFKLGPLYTPPIVDGTGGKRGTLTLPHNQGAANWQSAAADPETGMLYVPSVTNWFANSLIEAGERSDMRYIGRPIRPEMPLGLPLIKPPWGRITAMDMNTGDHAWMAPNGQAPQYVRDHPELKGIDLSGAGNPERAPLLVTKTLLFSGDGAGLFSSGPQGGGRKFRALDKKTGRTIFEMELPANETGVPMTYMADGRQFIVVAIGATGFPGELVALALPKAP
ncbi:MAG: pyrroloquinoline quinone-dependent dehydrogenase [Acidobacteria bacterium]|nr:pyrroloquinoline quinone-dependent dehydrogenase [Acidobacteriota bacterium]